MRNHRSQVRVAVLAGLLACAASTAVDAGTTIYVNASAGGANNGTSWANAYTSLQSGLAAAAAGDQIWVATGTYKPTTGTDRTISFQMKTGVPIYGGFAGNEPASFDLARRDFAAHPTILSGDLLGNDGPNFTNTGDNSYSVVTGDSVDATAILDGFTITAGEADDHDSNVTASSCGGGVFLNNANPTVRNCRLVRNRAWLGGAGMCNLSSSPTLSRCTFDDNHVTYGAAGAVLNYNGSNAGFADCAFVGNSAVTYGGAMYNVVARVSVLNCSFYGNSCEQSGGAVSDLMGPSTFTNCLFSGNKAESHDTPPSDTYGGAVIAQMSDTRLVNCTFWKNSAKYGGGVVNATSTATWPTLANCVLWDNPGGEIYTYSAQYPDVSHSDVKGGAPGTANTNSNPLFADADGPDNIIGTPDDNLHLLAGSPCIDAGGNAAVPAGVLTDLAGAARFYNDAATPDCRYLPGSCGTVPIVDMGAYEFIPIPCDADRDGDVDGVDHAAFEACASGPGIPQSNQTCAWAKLDNDGDVDQSDFSVFQRCYSGENVPADPNCGK